MPSDPTADQRPSARSRSRGPGKHSTSRASAQGAISAAPTPWTARPATSSAVLPASPPGSATCLRGAQAGGCSTPRPSNGWSGPPGAAARRRGRSSTRRSRCAARSTRCCGRGSPAARRARRISTRCAPPGRTHWRTRGSSRTGWLRLHVDGAALERPLWPVAHAALDLLRTEDLHRLAECGDCRWLFFDHSRNRSRRSCSMNACGGREKMRRHRARGRERAPAGTPPRAARQARQGPARGVQSGPWAGRCSTCSWP